jgi:hypothetical protein
VSIVTLGFYLPNARNLSRASDESTKGHPFTERQARIWANQEFPEKLGSSGFPSRAEFERDPYSGPTISLRHYFLGLHSFSALVRGQVKGWAESTAYMAASLTPRFRDLVVLRNASGLTAIWRQARVGTVTILILSLTLTLIGWVALCGDRELWWVPVLTLWGTWYVAYAYNARLVEPFRHTAHVYPFLLLSLVWGTKIVIGYPAAKTV